MRLLSKLKRALNFVKPSYFRFLIQIALDITWLYSLKSFKSFLVFRRQYRQVTQLCFLANPKF